MTGMMLPDETRIASVFFKYGFVFSHYDEIVLAEAMFALASIIFMLGVRNISARYRTKLNGVPIPDALMAIIIATTLVYVFRYAVFFLTLHIPNYQPPLINVGFHFLRSAYSVVCILFFLEKITQSYF